ncbi:MAG TPA: hypothetical protein VMV22_00875 [Acidimicrobiales bacterium]|nr:hypothetical protein [Acidimicrobiales bacterium]
MARRSGRHSRRAHAAAEPDGGTSAPTTAAARTTATATATATSTSTSTSTSAPPAPAPVLVTDGDGLEAGVVDHADVGTSAAPLALLAREPAAPAAPAAAPDGAVAGVIASGAPPPGPVLPALPGRSRHRAWAAPAVLVSVVVALAAVQLARPAPTPTWHGALHVASPVSGSAPALPWPATGGAAVAVPALGLMIQSGPEPAVPIASLAKLMTAYLTLHDHPLAAGDDGPEMQITAADQAEAQVEAAAGATTVPVEEGEALTERQMLDGLMVHSANNLADVLARWDAGTVPAFVVKMNATAAALGMTHTHYADASGLDPGTAGNAADVLRVTEADMAMPTFGAVVAQPAVTLPVAGVLPNYVQSVGTDGIVGVKSGFTQAAMGCLVLAGERAVNGRPVLVLAAVTGQTGADPLRVANQVDVQLIDAVASGMRTVDVVEPGTRVGTVTAPWSPAGVPAVTAAGASVIAWPGLPVRVHVWRRSLRPGLTPGSRVGTVSVSVGGERAVLPVRVTGSLRGPSVAWRLARR